MPSFSDLLGPTLVTKSNASVNTDEHLKDKVVGLYFSAHWCPPCRRFTPVLAKHYNSLKAAGKKFEIVFVSSDSDQKSFDEYYGEQPWAALPYADRNLKNKISKKFKIRGIPALVILDADGSIITTGGREAISNDPENFPWKPEPLNKILGTTFKGQNEKLVQVESFKDKKVVGLYFSAHWCPPCKAFTPKLAQVYTKCKELNQSFEVIFISSDNDESQFNEYFKEMPWLSIPFADDTRKKKLSSHFEIQGLPSLILLDSDLNLITKDGRAAIEDDAEAKEFPWEPKALNDISKNQSGIQDFPFMILLQENVNIEDQKKNQDVLQTVAQEYYNKAKENKKEMDVLFFYANSDCFIGQKVRDLLKIPKETTSKLCIVDVSESGFYISSMTDYTSESIKTLVSEFVNEKITLTKFGQ